MTSFHWALWPISLVSPLGQWGFCSGIEWELSKQGSVPREASVLQPRRCPDRSPILDGPNGPTSKIRTGPGCCSLPRHSGQSLAVGWDRIDLALWLLHLWSLLWNGGHILKPAMCSRRGGWGSHLEGEDCADTLKETQGSSCPGPAPAQAGETFLFK